MAQNILSIKDQRELSGTIHSDDSCPGVGCSYCTMFRKAAASVETASANGATITLTVNENPVGVKGWYLVWCQSCSDGENADFWDTCEWADRHATKRHSH